MGPGQFLKLLNIFNAVGFPDAVNFHPTNASILASFKAIDAVLGGLGGNSVNFSVYQSPQQTVPNNLLTQVVLNQKNFDSGNYFNTSDYKFLPLDAGVYIATFQGNWTPSPQDFTTQFFVYKNGSGGTLVAQTVPITIPAGTFVTMPPLTFEVQMNGTTDYLAVYCVQSQVTGTASLALHNTASNFYFCGALLNQKASDIIQSVNLQTVAISSVDGDDVQGKGTISFPFKTRDRALSYIGSSATPSSPFVILYDPGPYTETSFPILPNIYDYAAVPGSVLVTVTSGEITAYSSWEGATAKYTMSGLSFDNLTILNIDFSTFTSVNATINLDAINVAGESDITGKSSVTVTANLTRTYFQNGLNIQSVTNANVYDGNYIQNLTINPISAGTYNAFVSNNVWLGDSSFGADPIGTQNAEIVSSPGNSITLVKGGSGVANIKIDAASWINETTSGSPTITKLTPAAAISGLAASATTDTTNAANITSGTLPNLRLIGSYPNITGIGTLVDLNVTDTINTDNLFSNIVTSHTANLYQIGTIGQSGNTITGSGTTFTTAMKGGYLKWLSGALSGTYTLITAVNSATSLTVDTSATQAAGQSYEISYGGFTSLNQHGNSAIGFSNCTIYGQPTWYESQNFPNFNQVSGILTLGDSSTTNIVGVSTTGGQYLGSTAKPFGFLFLGSASNYVGFNTNTQSVNGAQVNVPDVGSASSKNIQLIENINVTGTTVTMSKWGAYFMNNASLVTGTFPSTIAQGDIFYVYGVGAGGWSITIPGGITFYNESTESGTVSLSSIDSLDSVMLVAMSSSKVSIVPLKGTPSLL